MHSVREFCLLHPQNIKSSQFPVPSHLTLRKQSCTHIRYFPFLSEGLCLLCPKVMIQAIVCILVLHLLKKLSLPTLYVSHFLCLSVSLSPPFYLFLSSFSTSISTSPLSCQYFQMQLHRPFPVRLFSYPSGCKRSLLLKILHCNYPPLCFQNQTA